MEVRVFDPKKNHYVYVGDVKDGIFTREIKKEHFVFKHKGYALQKEALEQLSGVKEIHLKLGGRVYKSTLDDWKAKGITDDLGHGEQRFLGVKHMELVDKDQPKLL